MTRVLDILIRARKLIEAPERWTKGAMARNSVGARVSAYAPDAICFCAQGALKKASDWDDHLSQAALRLNRAITIPVGYITYNDEPETTHADILALFDRAIEAERGCG
jgi:hypothetical protein